ncbi:capsular polysaccharide biosynthesis protein [Ruminiclostridium sufflavum DSM 19573]|uniref:Capsular polysaccharide biosynthesis protein n=2 Tax=Ruminiclostridium TaxID=1508657 RepID=A0A318Y232_9FIRM|nr:capsular polysaccharide biosynthesis protein [Ruminiclostridium sufflavum DSM 19573]
MKRIPKGEALLLHKLDGSETKMELNRFLNSIKRMTWLVILLGVLGGGGSAYLNIIGNTPVYKAETTIYAMNKNNTENGGKGINYQDVSLSRQLVMDYQYVLTSERVIASANKLLGKYNLSQERLISMVNIIQKNESSVIAISAVANDAETAADISNAVTEAFISELRNLTNNNIIGVLNKAKIPEYPINNEASKKIMIGFAAGVAIAFSLIYFRELFDIKIRYADDVEKTLKIRVIGAIPKYSVR